MVLIERFRSLSAVTTEASPQPTQSRGVFRGFETFENAGGSPVNASELRLWRALTGKPPRGASPLRASDAAAPTYPNPDNPSVAEAAPHATDTDDRTREGSGKKRRSANT